MNTLPYVISAELDCSAADTVCVENVEPFRENLDEALRGLGKQTTWVEAQELRVGMQRLRTGTALPIVSLDHSYVQGADSCLGISRAIDAELTDEGYDSRIGFPTLSEQFNELGKAYSGQEVVLADDVLFSGRMIVAVAQALRARQVSVSALFAGIAIGEGIKRLEDVGISTEAVVEDELCERDFAMVPGSGRKVYGQPCSALYFDAVFSNPEAWASIPADQTSAFCLGSLARNRRLLKPDSPLPPFLGYARGPAGRIIDATLRERVIT